MHHTNQNRALIINHEGNLTRFAQSERLSRSKMSNIAGRVIQDTEAGGNVSKKTGRKRNADAAA
jgi:hypothetical protein